MKLGSLWEVFPVAGNNLPAFKLHFYENIPGKIKRRGFELSRWLGQRSSDQPRFAELVALW